MGSQNIKSPAGLCKIAILVLGIVILGVGLHSHFESFWNASKIKINDNTVEIPTKLHTICDAEIPSGFEISLPDGSKLKLKETKCPKIAMEKYFVSMIIICFILSLVNFIASLLLDMKSKLLKLIDALYHVIAAVLLLIAAAVYLASAVQIKNLGFEDIKSDLIVKIRIHFLYEEKIAAGALTIIQSLLYVVTAIMVGRG